MQERLMGDFHLAKGLKARLGVAAELLKNLPDLTDKNTAVTEAVNMLNTEIATHQRTQPALALEATFVRDELRAAAGQPLVEGDLAPAKMPVIPGHQIVGTVERLGDGCQRLRVGMRVGVAWLRHTCGECRFCTGGRENLCPYSEYTGYTADGGYAEFAIVPSTSRIP